MVWPHWTRIGPALPDVDKTDASTTETTEGLDKKMSLHYYSRLRFINNLLPLVRAAAASPPPLARIISVLGGGFEGKIDTADLSLRNPGSYSLRAAANHTTSMTTLAFEHLANDPANKGIAFVHSNPGAVDTNIMRDFGTIMQKVRAISSVLLKPTGWVMEFDECGERHVWLGSSDKIASGMSLTGPKSEKAGDAMFKRLKSEGLVEKVWEHTEDVFGKISGEGQKYEG
jgi:NAD(P)-dependent dehydrogenase (short-subunit alcohol dehydrogenase family)